MIPHWSLSDRNSPRVSRTLLSILAVLNKASFGGFPLVVSLFAGPPVLVPILNWLYREHHLQLLSQSLSVFKNSLARSRYLSFFPLSFSFTLWSAETAKSSTWQVLFFFLFFYYYNVWPSGRDKAIRLYLRIPEKFVRLIFQDRFWVMHLPFVPMMKSKFLAQFPVDHLSHPVVSSFILFLC